MYLQSQGVKTVGVDVFVAQKDLPVVQGAIAGFELKAITNRGAKVWPGQDIRGELCDVFGCRFKPAAGGFVEQSAIVSLLQELVTRGFDFVHVERLLEINGKNAFSEMAGAE